MSWEEWVAIASLAISIVAVVVSLIYSRPQAKLALRENERRYKDELQRHYANLNEWFFKQLRERTGLSDFLLYDALWSPDSFYDQLDELWRGPGFSDYFQNGLKHIEKEHRTMADDILSIRNKMKQIRDEFEELLYDLMHKEGDPSLVGGLTTRTYPYPPGKIGLEALYKVLRSNWSNLMEKAPGGELDVSELAIKLPTVEFERSDNGLITWLDETVANSSSLLTSDELIDRMVRLMRDSELLQRIVNLYKMKVEFKRDVDSMDYYLKSVIQRVEMGTYDVHTTCCPEA